MDSIINIVKPKNHFIEINKVCAYTIGIKDNISNFKEKRASVYIEEWRHQRTCGEPDFVSV